MNSVPPVLICASDRSEYLQYIRRHGLDTRDYRYVQSSRHVLGLKPGMVILLGRYWLHPEWHQIQQELQIRFCHQYFETVETWL